MKKKICIIANINDNLKSNICRSKYCKNCKEENNYFCNECYFTNYEVNIANGQCVEKSAIPEIIWVDLYNFQINTKKEIYGQIYNGPSVIIRGVTNSQINSRHAFFAYLNLKKIDGIKMKQ